MTHILTSHVLSAAAVAFSRVRAMVSSRRGRTPAGVVTTASTSASTKSSLMRFIIGKYLSGLCKLDSVIVLKAGFETQLRAPRLSIPFGMSALSMTRQIGDGCLQSGIEFRHVSMLQGPDNVA